MGDPERERHDASRTAAVVARIEAAVASGDWPAALDLFFRDSVALLADRSRWSRDLLAAVPDDVPMDPLLQQVRAFVLGLPGGTELASADDERVPPAARAMAAMFQVVTLRTLGHLDEAERVARSVAPVLRRVEEAGVSDRLALVRLQIGILRLVRGDLDAAAEDLRTAYLVAWHARSDFVARNAAGDLALIHALRGDLPTARRWRDTFDAAPADLEGDFERRVRVGAVVASAFEALARLRPEEARRHVERLADVEPFEELWAFVAVARALLALAEGDAVAGLAELEAAESSHRSLVAGHGMAVRLLAATRSDLLLAVGQGARARAVVAATDDPSDAMTLRRARVALVTGELAEAIPLADAVAWGAGASVRSRTGGFVTAAVARWQLAEAGGPGAGKLRAEAHRMLGRAVELAAPIGLLQPFAYAPREDLLAVAGAGPDHAEALVLLEDPAMVAVEPVLPHRVPVVDLSERELAVLAQLATTRSLEVVAKRLFVSPNTVKTQVRQLYRKLGVHSREEALSAAYRQGLLAS